jgi:2-oxoisovalerate dehydrogenase E1 component
MRGHEEASGTKYVPQELFDAWKEKDPIDQYGSWLDQQGIMSKIEQENIRKELKQGIDLDVQTVFDEPELMPDRQLSIQDVFCPTEIHEQLPSMESTKPMRMIDAIRDAMDLAMELHSDLVLMGQDIGTYGGVFKATEGLIEKYGADRVRNTPLCESAIVSAALGLSIKGMKGMVEMQFADFVSSGFTAVVNNLAKSHWRWGQAADVVVRMPTGAGVAAGPFHSQSNEAWFFHTPGLKIYYPSNAFDAKGLLLTAFQNRNPVMFFEHKALYRSQEEEIPSGYYTLPEGKARICAEGEKISVITYGMGVPKTLACLSHFSDNSIEVIDLRTLVPLDWNTVFTSVKKTGRALILHEATDLGGIGADLAAKIQEHCFRWLDAPVKRISADDTPVPFAPALEEAFLPWSRLKDGIQELLLW